MSAGGRKQKRGSCSLRCTTNNINKMLTILGVLSVICVSCLNVASAETLKLVDNGYEGLTVSVSEDVPQEQCKRVVHGLKVIN